MEALDREGVKYSGERDQRYKRAPVTRWIEDLAKWCCGIRGQEGVSFRGIADFWLKLMQDAGHVVPEYRHLSQRCFLFGVLEGLQKPNMPIHEWLSMLENAISIQECLNSLEERPEEKEAFATMLSACGKGMPLYSFSVADLAGCGANSNVITLTTLHSSKGLQFDVVIIPGMEQGRLPSYRATSETALKEARRTFYVGVTRSRHLVYLLYSGWYKAWGRVHRNGPSRFVIELQESLQCQIER